MIEYKKGDKMEPIQQQEDMLKLIQKKKLKDMSLGELQQLGIEIGLTQKDVKEMTKKQFLQKMKRVVLKDDMIYVSEKCVKGGVISKKVVKECMIDWGKKGEIGIYYADDEILILPTQVKTDVHRESGINLDDLEFIE